MNLCEYPCLRVTDRQTRSYLERMQLCPSFRTQLAKAKVERRETKL